MAYYSPAWPCRLFSDPYVITTVIKKTPVWLKDIYVYIASYSYKNLVKTKSTWIARLIMNMHACTEETHAGLSLYSYICT